VPEYWLVMPKEQIVEIFRLENAEYKRLGSYAFEDEVACLALPKLMVELSEIFGEKNEY